MSYEIPRSQRTQLIRAEQQHSLRVRTQRHNIHVWTEELKGLEPFRGDGSSLDKRLQRLEIQLPKAREILSKSQEWLDKYRTIKKNPWEEEVLALLSEAT